MTFSISYVVVIVRSRLASIGPEYEEAARDLGASARAVAAARPPAAAVARRLAATLIVFALSIDDFVVTQYMSSSGETTTVPMLLYANARGAATTPALNAVATIMVLVTLIGVGGAYLVLRWFAGTRGEKDAAGRWAGPDAESRWTMDGGSDGATAIAAGIGGHAGGEVELEALEKRFDDVVAVDSIDLDIAAGRVLLAARPLGLRQDDDAADGRGLRATDRGGVLLDGAASPPSRPTAATSTRCSRTTRSSRT